MGGPSSESATGQRRHPEKPMASAAESQVVKEQATPARCEATLGSRLARDGVAGSDHFQVLGDVSPQSRKAYVPPRRRGGGVEAIDPGVCRSLSRFPQGLSAPPRIITFGGEGGSYSEICHPR